MSDDRLARLCAAISADYAARTLTAEVRSIASQCAGGGCFRDGVAELLRHRMTRDVLRMLVRVGPGSIDERATRLDAAERGIFDAWIADDAGAWRSWLWAGCAGRGAR